MLATYNNTSHPTVEKRATIVRNAASHSVKLEILKGICSPTLGRRSTGAPSAIIYSIELLIWEPISQPTVEKRTTIVHNAISHSVKPHLWKLTYSPTLEKRSTGAHNATIQPIEVLILESTLSCRTLEKNSAVQSVWLFFNSIRQFKATQNDPLWGKASEMHNLQIFMHYNWWP